MPRVTNTTSPTIRRQVLGSLALALLTSLATPTARAQHMDPPSAAPTIIGCSWAPPGSVVELVTEAPDADDNESDEASTQEREPKIVGTVPAPPNTRPNDQRRLASVAKVSKDEAVQRALAVLPDVEKRRVTEAELEIEQGWVVWGVETVFKGREQGQDRYAEVIIDAGNGSILLVECEFDDD